MTKEQILEQFGLTDKQARVYLALLELGEARIGPLAARSGIKRTSIYNFMHELVQLGIITKFEHNGRDVYRAEDPKRLQALYEQRGRELRELLPELDLLYQAAGVTPTRVSYFRNPSEMKQLLFSPLHGNVKQIDWLWARDLMRKVFGQETIDEFKQRREAAGIFSRILQPRTPESPKLNANKDKLRRREKRYVPAHITFSASVLIFGDHVSFISSRKENFGVLIQSKEFAEACRVMFEGLWTISKGK